jgi:hypothetical protein
MATGAGGFEGAREVDYRGRQFALGRTDDAYAIWRLTGGPPVRTFPLTDQAWPEAWLTYQAWEAGVASPSGEPPPVERAAAWPTGPAYAGPVMDYPGGRYGLGRAEGRYYIWDLDAWSAVESFPQDEGGWRDAWSRFQELDRPYTFVPTSQWRKGQPIPIRAMRAGQVVAATFKLYFSYFWVLIGLIAVVFVPVEIISGTLAVSTLETVTTDVGFGPTQTVQNPPWVGIVNGILYLLAIPFITASVLAAVGQAFLGRRVTLASAYRVGFRRAVPVLWVTVLLTLAILALFIPAFLVALAAAVTGSESGALVALLVILILAAIPFAIFLSVRFFFGTSTVVLESHRGVAALRRSWNLVRGLGWKIFGNFLLIGLIQAGIGLVFILIGLAVAAALFLGDVVTAAGGVNEETFRNFLIFSSVLNAITTVILTPFSTVAIVLLYFDARLRKEGFTEDVLAREYGAAFPEGPMPAGPPPASPPPSPAP